MGASIGLHGEKELLRALAKLDIPIKEQRKAIRPAANLIKRRAQELVPEITGALKRSIGTRVLRGEPAAIAVRPRYGRSESKKTGKVTAGFHAHLVEYGTPPRLIPLGKRWKTTLGGRAVYITNTGAMPAQPFMRPAFEQMAGPAQRMLIDKMWNLIKQRAQRAPKGVR